MARKRADIVGQKGGFGKNFKVQLLQNVDVVSCRNLVGVVNESVAKRHNFDALGG
jgi:hypothetical protein